MTKFTTYLHRRNDTGAIFYVGKGSVSRAHSSRGRSEYWRRVSAKHGRTVEIVAHWATEQEALDHEVFLIWCLRDMGVALVNRTNGGDGMSGHTHSEETKKRMSAAALGRKMAESSREKLRLYRMGKPVEPHVRKLIGEFHKRRVRPASEYVNQRATNATEATKRRRSEAMRAMLAKPGVLARMLESRANSTAWAESMAKRRKPVLCVESKTSYPSASHAAEALGLHKSNVCAVCNGKAKTSGGLTFRWLELIEPPPVKAKTTELERSE